MHPKKINWVQKQNQTIRYKYYVSKITYVRPYSVDFFIYAQSSERSWAVHMQAILLTRHYQVEVISILKEKPKEEELVELDIL